jgi:pyrroloquinoline quinone biosynthesis protein B
MELWVSSVCCGAHWTRRKATQCSVAVSADGRRWVLINASPDLRSQLLCFPAQLPLSRRETPIEAVLLTDVDLDHTLGLFLLRESDSEVSIHASSAIREALDEGLRLTEILNHYCGIRWVEAPPDFTPLFCRDGTQSGLEYRAIEIQGPGPRYCRNQRRSCRVFYVLGN